MYQAVLLDAPLLSFTVLPIERANDLLTEWGHRLGPCKRPFRQEAFALVGDDGRPLSLAISASAVSATVAGFCRDQVVECARLCSAPVAPWMTRVMLRLWRQICAPRWANWPVQAAISYSQNGVHRGDIYRFDGWEKVREDCGSSGGGAWSRQRYAGEAVYGKKTLWVWRYPLI